jgi:hypothetical protein
MTSIYSFDHRQGGDEVFGIADGSCMVADGAAPNPGSKHAAADRVLKELEDCLTEARALRDAIADAEFQAFHLTPKMDRRILQRRASDRAGGRRAIDQTAPSQSEEPPRT